LHNIPIGIWQPGSGNQSNRNLNEETDPVVDASLWWEPDWPEAENRV
jgi:hypothetical protein